MTDEAHKVLSNLTTDVRLILHRIEALQAKQDEMARGIHRDMNDLSSRLQALEHEHIRTATLGSVRDKALAETAQGIEAVRARVEVLENSGARKAGYLAAFAALAGSGGAAASAWIKSLIDVGPPPH